MKPQTLVFIPAFYYELFAVKAVFARPKFHLWQFKYRESVFFFSFFFLFSCKVLSLEHHTCHKLAWLQQLSSLYLFTSNISASNSKYLGIIFIIQIICLCWAKHSLLYIFAFGDILLLQSNRSGQQHREDHIFSCNAEHDSHLRVLATQFCGKEWLLQLCWGLLSKFTRHMRATTFSQNLCSVSQPQWS